MFLHCVPGCWAAVYSFMGQHTNTAQFNNMTFSHGQGSSPWIVGWWYTTSCVHSRENLCLLMYFLCLNPGLLSCAICMLLYTVRWAHIGCRLVGGLTHQYVQGRDIWRDIVVWCYELCRCPFWPRCFMFFPSIGWDVDNDIWFHQLASDLIQTSWTIILSGSFCAHLCCTYSLYGITVRPYICAVDSLVPKSLLVPLHLPLKDFSNPPCGVSTPCFSGTVDASGQSSHTHNIWHCMQRSWHFLAHGPLCIWCTWHLR